MKNFKVGLSQKQKTDYNLKADFTIKEHNRGFAMEVLILALLKRTGQKAIRMRNITWKDGGDIHTENGLKLQIKATKAELGCNPEQDGKKDYKRFSQKWQAGEGATHFLIEIDKNKTLQNHIIVIKVAEYFKIMAENNIEQKLFYFDKNKNKRTGKISYAVRTKMGKTTAERYFQEYITEIPELKKI